jgi:MerR family copper efflux transcriptional regulator
MYIGELAKLSGATPKAIRHYEALGLLGKVQRSGVYRCYGASELAQIRLIKQAQLLGFKLSELATSLAAHAGQPDWLGLSQQIQEKRQAVQTEIARLTSLDLQLTEVHQEILSCLGGEPSTALAELACSAPELFAHGADKNKPAPA